jgi:hypothetical protein
LASMILVTPYCQEKNQFSSKKIRILNSTQKGNSD